MISGTIKVVFLKRVIETLNNYVIVIIKIFDEINQCYHLVLTHMKCMDHKQIKLDKKTQNGKYIKKNNK